MKNQSRLLLSTLLFLYLTGRLLQPFAGRIPDLLLVALHVIPPAFFALIHGAKAYRWRGILLFTGLCLGVSTFFESLSLRTGFPFGHYRFTDLMGPKLSGLPILIAMAYVGMGYLSWVVSVAILGGGRQMLPRKRLILLPLLAGVVMTVWDVSMEAVWADIDRGWVWQDGGPYFGVPISNFLGWLLTTCIFYQLFAFYLKTRQIVPSSKSERLPAIAFYALSALGNLLVIPPSSPPGLFVDATGRQWMILHILWASRFVSIFLMLPFSLIAWFRLWPPPRSGPSVVTPQRREETGLAQTALHDQRQAKLPASSTLPLPS